MVFGAVGSLCEENDLTQKGNAHALQALPPASKTSPHARTFSEVKHPKASSSSSSLPSGGQAWGGGGGVLGMHLVLRPVRLPLLPLDLGPARGVEVSLVAHPVRASALLPPLLLRELGRGRLLVRSGRPLPAPLPRLTPRSSQHALRRGESGESSEVRSRSRSSRVSRSSDRGTRKDRRARSLSASSRDRSRRSRSRSASRSRSSGREPRLSRCPPASGRGVSSRSLRTAPSRVVFALAETNRSCRDRSRRDRSRFSGRYRSRRQRSRSLARRGGRRDHVTLAVTRSLSPL